MTSSTILRLCAQAAVVILFTVAGSLLVGQLRFGSPLNLMWVLVLPALIGILFNKGTTMRIVIAAGLVIISFATLVVFAGPAGLGPS